MSKFIRIDNIGEWRGTDHKSFLGMIDDESAESGISCYEMIKGFAENLYDYWNCEVGYTSSKNRQITIFEGEYVGRGSSDEDLATCTKTIAELPASMLFDNIEFFESVEDGYEYYDEDEEEEISFEDDMFENLDKYEFIEKVIIKASGLN